MHSRLFLCLALILAILLSSSSAHAQQDINAALREKAFDLLESVAGQLSTLQSAENRARLGANIADSLWKHDEKRARAVLVMVQQDINSGLELKQTFNETERHTFQVFYKLRLDTIERIGKYDGELALEFLKATEPRVDKESRGIVFGERQLELKLAKQIAANSPEVALKVGRKWLEQGFTGDIVSVLTQLNKKHKEQALTFYKEIIHKLKDADLSSNWETTNFVETLAKFKPPDADETTYRELVEVIISSALAKGCANKTNEEDEAAYYCRWASSIVPQMDKIDPRGARLRRWVDGRTDWQEHPQFNSDLEEVAQAGTADEILALTAKYPERAEYVIYRAVQKVRETGDLEQARKIANRLPDSASRRYILGQIESDEKWAKVDDEKLVELEARINAIENLRERVGALLGLSHQLGVKNQKVVSRFLNQASEIIDTMKPGKEQTEAQLAVALVYCSEKNDRGLSLMESLVPKLNELVDLAVKLDGYDTRYLRDGEWNMSANGAVGQLLTGLSNNAGYFAWCDFDRAVSLAGRFDRAEIRLMAQVKLAQSILSGPPKRSRTDFPAFRQ